MQFILFYFFVLMEEAAEIVCQVILRISKSLVLGVSVICCHVAVPK